MLARWLAAAAAAAPPVNGVARKMLTGSCSMTNAYGAQFNQLFDNEVCIRSWLPL
jgi:hypothetical protein